MEGRADTGDRLHRCVSLAMRHAPLSGDLRNIRRVDYRKPNGGAWTHLWQVYFVFKGRKPVSESFSDTRYGGKAPALAAAQRFRNAMENEFAASEIGYGKFGDVLTNPEHGITRYCGKRNTSGGVREHWYWQATWPGIEKKAVNRRFKFSLHGGSDGAKAAAIAARRQGYEEYLNALRNGRVARMKNGSGSEDRAPYTLFMPPDDLDVRVWRYMDFTKFVSMLEHGGIFLPVVAQLGDPFEGSYARGNEILRPLVYRHIKNEYNLSAGEMVQRLRWFVPASCWHSNKQESAAMWKLYAQEQRSRLRPNNFPEAARGVRFCSAGGNRALRRL